MNADKRGLRTEAHDFRYPRSFAFISGRLKLFFVALIPILALAADVDPRLFLAHVRYLASPELKGRATGSPQLEKAASYIAGQFQMFGLKPLEGKDFEQAFPVTIGATLGPGNHL